MWLRKLVLDASGYETRKALHLVLTLKDGAAGTYLWSESLTPGTPRDIHAFAQEAARLDPGFAQPAESWLVARHGKALRRPGTDQRWWIIRFEAMQVRPSCELISTTVLFVVPATVKI